MKLFCCFGTRPEAIKMAPVIIALREKKLKPIICITGQHREMLDQVLEFFEIIPDFDLNLMKPNQDLNILSAEILSALNDLLKEERPDMVLVQGDTQTAFLCAFAAFNLGIRISHIEAGLRTYDLKSPYPEEANRQLLSRIADLHFTPTRRAHENLIKENIPSKKIIFTGNTIVDALNWGNGKIEDNKVPSELEQLWSEIKTNSRIILVTGHRRENFEGGLEEICKALITIAEFENVQIIFPVHLNPNVRNTVNRFLLKIKDIQLIEPVSYSTMLWLIKKSSLIITDSGGIQEEAPSFKKPVIVTRNTTERPEALEAGFSFLTGTLAVNIVKEAERILSSTFNFENKLNPFGDGNAAKRIVKNIINYD